MFKRIVSAAALAGVFAGLLLTAIQQIEITRLIREAEVQEEATIAASQSAHEHASTGREQEAWAPRRGWERLLATAVSNTVLATGFALLLVSAMSQQKKTGWRAGLLWGAAGYAVFFVAPSLGLPPELPGTESAPLRDRTLWAPHAIGAPQPPAHGETNSVELAKDFLRATYFANAAFWLALGGLLGLFYKARQ